MIKAYEYEINKKKKIDSEDSYVEQYTNLYVG